MTFENIFFDNISLAKNKWALGFDSLLWQYGRGAFTTTLYYRGKIFFLTDHLARLEKTCRYLGIPYLKIERQKLHSFLTDQTKSIKDIFNKRFKLRIVCYSERGRGHFIVEVTEITAWSGIVLRDLVLRERKDDLGTDLSGSLGPLASPQKIISHYSELPKPQQIGTDVGTDVLRKDLSNDKIIECGVANVGLLKRIAGNLPVLCLVEHEKILKGILQSQIVKRCATLFSQIVYCTGFNLSELTVGKDFAALFYLNSLRGVLPVLAIQTASKNKRNGVEKSLPLKTDVHQQINRQLGYIADNMG